MNLRFPLPSRAGHRLRSLWRCRRGMAAVEMALMAPVLIALLLGTLDLGWRILASYKLEHVVATLADLAARSRELSSDDLDDIFEAASPIAEPFALADAMVVLSGVRDDTGSQPVVVWQEQRGSANGETSRIGQPGGSADLDGLLDLDASESVIVAELFFRFDPLVGFVFREPMDLYFVWVARPRSGAVTELL